MRSSRLVSLNSDCNWFKILAWTLLRDSDAWTYLLEHTKDSPHIYSISRASSNLSFLRNKLLMLNKGIRLILLCIPLAPQTVIEARGKFELFSLISFFPSSVAFSILPLSELSL